MAQKIKMAPWCLFSRAFFPPSHCAIPGKVEGQEDNDAITEKSHFFTDLIDFCLCVWKKITENISSCRTKKKSRWFIMLCHNSVTFRFIKAEFLVRAANKYFIFQNCRDMNPFRRLQESPNSLPRCTLKP